MLHNICLLFGQRNFNLASGIELDEVGFDTIAEYDPIKRHLRLKKKRMGRGDDASRYTYLRVFAQKGFPYNKSEQVVIPVHFEIQFIRSSVVKC